MLYYSLYGDKISKIGVKSIDEALRRLKHYPIFVSEVLELTEYIIANLDKKTFSIGIATLIGNELSDIHHLKGTKEECIDFLNEDMFRRYVDESLKAKVVINLAFDEDEFNAAFSENSTKEEKEAYKKSIELWYSLDELAEMGAIELR